MRFVVFLLTALCLSALSFSAAADTRADAAPGIAASMSAGDVIDAAFYEGVIDAVELPGDDPLEAEATYFDNAPPPGYCNIWSADLLDPLDLLDEIEESSALFVLPVIPPVEFPEAPYVATVGGRLASRPEGLLRPPNPRA